MSKLKSIEYSLSSGEIIADQFASQNTNKTANIAQIIVDVPTAATDKAYDYLIPDDLIEHTSVGSRVIVQFGKRYLIGYIVNLKQESSTPLNKLKNIQNICDLAAPLTKELVELGFAIADKYFCHLITALQSMLPSALRGKYERKVFLLENAQYELSAVSEKSKHFIQHLLKFKSLKWESALDLIDIKTLKSLISDKIIYIQEIINDKVIQRTAIFVKATSSKLLLLELDNLNKRATRQREALEFFLNHLFEEFNLSFLTKEHGLTKESLKILIEKQLLSVRYVDTYLDPYSDHDFVKSEPKQLTLEQQTAFDTIKVMLNKKEHASALLQGVTGSGKTELYLQAIAETLQLGKEVITLVPEISLTPQMVERFKSRFGSQVAVLHSRLSQGERYDEWRKIRSGQAKIAIGARSAIFAPFEKLGLIIIDEEHELSYKQEDNPKYHACEVALWRAKAHNAVLLLGSATPSLETYYDARTGVHSWLQLKERVLGQPMPRVQVIDMRQELSSGNRSIFSKALIASLEQTIARSQQAVLFLNRRGFATSVICRECGDALLCKHCDISLTYHKYNQSVQCHYCGFVMQMPSLCPECESPHIRHFGTGTQRIETELLDRFPELRVIRMDVDTTSRKGSHERLLNQFLAHEADVLIGTQMIAKGLDFPKVSLVGVISADITLNLPDFRAAERTFQLLTQVGGRAGRHETSGEVIVQTYTPNHYSIEMVANQEIEKFFRQELLLRKKHKYPPFYGLFKLMLSHTDETQLSLGGSKALKILRSSLPRECEVLGPVQATIFKIKDRYRSQIMIKYPSMLGLGSDIITELKKILKEVLDLASTDKLLKISVETEYR